MATLLEFCGQIDPVLASVGDEEPADELGQSGAIPWPEKVEQLRDLRLEASGHLAHERSTASGQTDDDRSSVRGRGNPHDQPTALGPVYQATRAGLVESEQLGQLIHRWLPIPQHAQQACLDDRDVMLGRQAFKHPVNEKRGLGQAVDWSQIGTGGGGAVSPSSGHGLSLLALVRATN